MQSYQITGMSCAACSSRVEKAVKAVEGVTEVSVNLLTNSMTVSGTASADSVIAAVEQAGYGAAPSQGITDRPTTAAPQKTESTLKPRLISSILLLLVLMYFSMGHMMWGWPLPSRLNGNHIAMGLIQLLLTAGVMVINQKFFISGFRGLWHRAPNMDTLVALGASASFLWSVAALFMMTDAQLSGDHARVMTLMHEFYFESAAMILTLITVGKMLEAHSKGKTTDALKGLLSLSPKTAVVLREGKEVTVPVEEVAPGDSFVMRPGESIPTDGVVTRGTGAVNESALTGESIPVEKAPGDPVSAATVNQSGFLECRATRVGADTTLSQIIRMVSDAAATKAPIAKIADRVSGVFVPAVIALSLLTFLVWRFLGQTFPYALARGISVLVISCPCALGLATPVAIMVGNGVGAKQGILFKTAQALEETGKVKIVALDKTGTVTQGEPRVTDLIPDQGCTEEELLTIALSLEQKSEHPLAKAVCTYETTLTPCEVTDFSALPGNGVTARCSGEEYFGGSLRFIETRLPLSPAVKRRADALSEEGKTPLLFGSSKRFLGMIAVADTIKPDSPAAIRTLQEMGIQVIMLTGDHEKTAQVIGEQAGVDQVIAGVLPDEKEKIIRRLQQKGKVAMVGDGINDAPALKRADTGIAIGAGTDIAIDAADVVLMKSILSDVPAAIRLSRATLRNIHENLFWAFFYNTIGIPLAAGVFVPLGLTLNPMFGAAAMSLSSFCVVTNALRLNLFRTPANQAPQTVLRVKGMMCAHCEGRVKQALEQLDGVTCAQPNHKTGKVILTTSHTVDPKQLRSAVEQAGYHLKKSKKG